MRTLRPAGGRPCRFRQALSAAAVAVPPQGPESPRPPPEGGPSAFGAPDPQGRGGLALLQREGSRRACGRPGATRPVGRSGQTCPHCWSLPSSGRCGGQRRCPRPGQGSPPPRPPAARRGVPTGGCLCAEAGANGLKIAWAERRAIFSQSGGPSQFPGQRPLGQDGSGGLGMGGSPLQGPHPSWASPPSRPRGTAGAGEGGGGERAWPGIDSLGGGGRVARGRLSSTQPPSPSCPCLLLGWEAAFYFEKVLE